MRCIALSLYLFQCAKVWYLIGKQTIMVLKIAQLSVLIVCTIWAAVTAQRGLAASCVPVVKRCVEVEFRVLKIHAYAKQGVVVDHGVGGAHLAQNAGELNHRFAVVGAAGHQT